MDGTTERTTVPSGQPAPHGVVHHRVPRGSRRVLVAATVAAVLLFLLGSPLRILALLGDVRVDDRGVTTPSPGPTGEATASVSTDVTGVVVRGSGASGTSTVPSGDVTEGRWGATSDRPGGLELLFEEVRGGWRVEGGNEEAAALAVIAAHAWADVRGRPSGTRTGDSDGQATGAIVTVEAVERPGPHHAVVTALVAPDGAAGPLHRIAIPLVMGPSGPMLAGAPWSLPVHDLPPVSILGMPVDDPELIASARRALDAAELRGDRLVSLEATHGWPFIARLDDDAEAHPWLRWHLDRFVIAGLPLSRATDTRPQDARP